jgi:Mrp family chromosome partitioning ATPase
MMITSPAPGDGKTLTAINFAMCLAERAPVLLVDLDTRRPSVPHKLGLPQVDHGIEDVLLEKRTPESCLLTIRDTKLCVALNKGGGREVVDLMHAGRLKEFLEWAHRRFSWIVIDTPPIFPIADTLEISNHATVGILIVRARKTPTPMINRAIEALRGRIQYLVLNDSETTSYSTYKYDDYYYFSRPNERREGRLP